jgi:hypothetical protein
MKCSSMILSWLCFVEILSFSFTNSISFESIENKWITIWTGWNIYLFDAEMDPNESLHIDDVLYLHNKFKALRPWLLSPIFSFYLDVDQSPEFKHPACLLPFPHSFFYDSQKADS